MIIIKSVKENLKETFLKCNFKNKAMQTFYIIHYSNDNGTREYVVITAEKPTEQDIDDNCIFGMQHSRTIDCSTNNPNFDLLPLNESLEKH